MVSSCFFHHFLAQAQGGLLWCAPQTPSGWATATDLHRQFEKATPTLRREEHVSKTASCTDLAKTQMIPVHQLNFMIPDLTRRGGLRVRHSPPLPLRGGRFDGSAGMATDPRSSQPTPDPMGAFVQMDDLVGSEHRSCEWMQL